MDRYLLSGAILLLFIEVTVLFGDLQLIPWPYSQNDEAEAQKLGAIVTTHEEVRRRAKKSIVWEDSEEKDQLFAYDSLLTLANSAAKIQLQNDIKVHIFENTLVVLEPPEKNSDIPIRLRFGRGNMRSQNGQRLRVGSGDWIIDANAGSDLSLRSLKGGNVEVEVTQGELTLVHEKNKSKQEVQQGQRISLSGEKIEKIQNLSADLSWDMPNSFKIYSHYFPTTVHVKWKGDAKTLNYFKPGQEIVSEKVKGLSDFFLMLEAGSYYFSLENENNVSRSLALHVITAPKIRHFSPLPRTRFKTATAMKFSWSKPANVKSYEVELGVSSSFLEPIATYPTQQNFTKLEIDHTGKLYWRIKMFDEDNFPIPAFFASPIYSVKNPIPAPIIKVPVIDRWPAGKPQPNSPVPEKLIDESNGNKPKKSPPDQGAMERMWNYIFPAAHGQEGPQRMTNSIEEPEPDPIETTTDEQSPKDLKPTLGSNPAVTSTTSTNSAIKTNENVNSMATPKLIKTRKVSFEWEPVKGADFYIIEVSETPDFEQPIINQRVYSSSFSWDEAYKQDVYFIRVAGGSVNGRMGLFSKVQAMDLRKIAENNNVGFTTPMPLVSDLKPEASVVQGPTEEKATVSKKNQESATEESAKNSADKEDKPIEFPDMAFSLYFTSAYQQQKFSLNQGDDEDFESKFSGLKSMDMRLSFQNQALYFEGITELMNWEVDKDEFPTQESIEIWHYQIYALYQTHHKWYFGFNHMTRGVFERASYETIKNSSTQLPGFTTMWKSSKDDWTTILRPSISINSDYNYFQLNCYILKSFKIERWNFSLGGQFNAYQLKGDKSEDTGGDLGLSFGFEF